MTSPLRPVAVLRQCLREGRYAEVRDEIRDHQPDGLEYQKCLCDALAQLRDWGGAIGIASRFVGHDPYFSALLVAKFCQNAGDFTASQGWLERARTEEGETIGYLITASKAALGLGDRSRAVALGQRVLEAKDQNLGRAIAVDPMRGGNAKILSFSLFGTGEIYLFGALANARLWAKMAPDWTCRFYVTPDVPQGVTVALEKLGAEIVLHESPKIPAYLARFLPFQDPGVARFACRDVDCRPTRREVEILREWEQSAFDFHLIRNHPLHTDMVLAGLWGGVPLQGFDLAADIAACFPNGASNKYGLDQYYLERRIWPRIKGNVLAFDAHYRLEGIETRPVEDPQLGGGHHDVETVRRELDGLGIRVS